MCDRTGILLAWALFCVCLSSCVQAPPGDDGNPDDDDDVVVLPELPPPVVSVPDDSLVPVPALSSQPLLNEVRHEPFDAEFPFVELKGVVSAHLAAGLWLANEHGDTYNVPVAVQPADAHGLITIHFDGQNRIEADVVHADRTAFLTPASGMVVLQEAGGAELDRLIWGDQRPGAVVQQGTGASFATKGMTLARRPQATTPGLGEEWYVAAAAEATPGQPNRNLGVHAPLPPDGTFELAGEISVTWEFVRAQSFRVQVAADADFAQVVLDQAVEQPPVALMLAPGGYYWRVQATLSDGSLSDWSDTNRLLVVESLPPDDPADGPAAKHLIFQQAAPRQTSLGNRVPMYYQHKDSHMLLLESDKLSGTPHAWDAPHSETSWSDPADYSNCSAACISMVNGYLTGASSDKPNLTQDRVGFEVYSKFEQRGYSGPEFDLNFNMGMSPPRLTHGLSFAVGTAVSAKVPDLITWTTLANLDIYIPLFREQFWKDVQDSVARDMPVICSVYLGSKLGTPHSILATGTQVVGGKRFVLVNDPMRGPAGGRTRYPLESLRVYAYWILPDGVASLAPVMDDPSYTSPPSKAAGNDDDDDGLSDWDEIRFGTNPNKADTDGDCVDDLAEIRASVFDRKHGWGIHQTAAALNQSSDSDGSARPGSPAPELDGQSSDIDGSGLPDPMEDLNLNGQHEPELGESSIFDPEDDARTIKGYREIVEDSLDAEPNIRFEIKQREEFELQVNDGEIKGKVSVTRNYKTTQQFPAFPGVEPEACAQPRTRTTTMRELKYTRDVRAYFECQVLRIVADPHIPLPDQPVDIIDPCWYPGSVGVGTMQVFPFAFFTGFTPFSIESGKVVYRFSTTTNQNLQLTGTFHTEYEVTIERP